MQAKVIISSVILLVILIVIIANFPIVVINAGERGVVFNNASGVENRILSEGTHFRTPFVESIIAMPVRTQANAFDEAAGTSDSQIVDVKLTVTWHLDASKVNTIYQKIGDNDAVISNILTNNTQDAVKAATSKYVALDIQRNRDNVAARALTLLQGKVQRYGVLIDGLSLTNISFSDQFNAAVENAQKANQDAIAAENHVKEVQADAQSAIAQAQGQAQAQSLVQQSLTPELLEKLWIEKWNGALPATQFGSSNSPIPTFNLSQ